MNKPKCNQIFNWRSKVLSVCNTLNKPKCNQIFNWRSKVLNVCNTLNKPKCNQIFNWRSKVLNVCNTLNKPKCNQIFNWRSKVLNVCNTLNKIYLQKTFTSLSSPVFARTCVSKGKKYIFYRSLILIGLTPSKLWMTISKMRKDNDILQTWLRLAYLLILNFNIKMTNLCSTVSNSSDTLSYG